jgi:hypothetical protein
MQRVNHQTLNELYEPFQMAVKLETATSSEKSMDLAAAKNRIRRSDKQLLNIWHNDLFDVERFGNFAGSDLFDAALLADFNRSDLFDVNLPQYFERLSNGLNFPVAALSQMTCSMSRFQFPSIRRGFSEPVICSVT